MANVRITCSKVGPIPGLGTGPIRNPVSVSQEKYENLKTLGYPVQIVDMTKRKVNIPKSPLAPKEDNEEVEMLSSTKVSTSQPPLSSPKTVPPHKPLQHEPLPSLNGTEEGNFDETVVDSALNEGAVNVSGEVKESVESSLEGDSTDEGDILDITLNDPEGSAEAFYEPNFITTKAQASKILDARKVQYKDKSSLEVLKKLVIESNPDVTFEEEE